MKTCVDCTHLGIIMGPSADALMELKKKYWIETDPEGYDSVARGQKQSQCQSASIPGPSQFDGQAAKQLPIKLDESQAKRISVKPTLSSDATPIYAASESRSQVHASEGIKPASQPAIKSAEQADDQPQSVASLLHPSPAASQHAEHAEPAKPLSHRATPVFLKSAPTSRMPAASTDFTDLHPSTPEQHEDRPNKDAKQQRLAAYAANRQGAQLEAANCLPRDANLLTMTPGMPPSEDAVNGTTGESSAAWVPPNVTTGESSAAWVPANSKTSISTRSGRYLILSAPGTQPHHVSWLCCLALCTVTLIQALHSSRPLHVQMPCGKPQLGL